MPRKGRPSGSDRCLLAACTATAPGLQDIAPAPVCFCAMSALGLLNIDTLLHTSTLLADWHVTGPSLIQD